MMFHFINPASHFLISNSEFLTSGIEGIFFRVHFNIVIFIDLTYKSCGERGFGGGLSSIHQLESEFTSSYVLHQNYPNPFNPKTTINYELQISSYVRLEIFDIMGRKIEELVSKRQNVGEYKIEFDDSDLTSGLYLYKLEVLSDKENKVFSDTKRMLLIK